MFMVAIFIRCPSYNHRQPLANSASVKVSAFAHRAHFCSLFSRIWGFSRWSTGFQLSLLAIRIHRRCIFLAGWKRVIRVDKPVSALTHPRSAKYKRARQKAPLPRAFAARVCQLTGL
jgi:hypothetical protein